MAALVLLGIFMAVIGAPALGVWRFVKWNGGEIVAPTSTAIERSAQNARVLKARVQQAVFSGLLPGWAIALALLLLGTFIR